MLASCLRQPGLIDKKAWRGIRMVLAIDQERIERLMHMGYIRSARFSLKVDVISAKYAKVDERW